jgi:hypothetical protein
VVYLEGAEVEVDQAYFEVSDILSVSCGVREIQMGHAQLTVQGQGIALLCIPLDVQTPNEAAQMHSPSGGSGKRLFTPEAVEWALERIMGTSR